MPCGRSWGLSSEAGGGRALEGQTFRGESLLVRYVNFVKLPHTVFALPFALLGLLVASRELPSGRLTLRQAWSAVGLAAALFLWTAWALNPLCFVLAPPALVFIAAYSYAKRFTHWSHLWLGLADGIAVPAGYLAVTGRWSEPWWLLPVGALAVTFWVGGFDVFYALQDEAFDRAERLASLVVRFGQARAILVAKLLHGLALAALVLFGLGAR